MVRGLGDVTSYHGMTSDSPWPNPVPALSVAVGTRPGRPVAPSGSVGDAGRSARGGAPIVPAVSGGASIASAGRALPAAHPTGSPPAYRAASGSGASTGAVATAPADAPPAPTTRTPAQVQGTPVRSAAAPPIAPPTRGHRTWERHT